MDTAPAGLAGLTGLVAAAAVPSRPSTPRGLPINPVQGIRRALPTINTPPTQPLPPPPPMPAKGNTQSAISGASLSALPSMSSSQVINLVQEKMKAALWENEHRVAEASSVSNELKPGVAIDLSQLKIQHLPNEVVDIIKNELERLVLSQNRLTTFPARFSECTTLRYLNVRYNHIEEFPLALCDLKSLEYLDLSRNRIRTLPREIAKLTSLKVLSLRANLIEELPLCLADMGSLQVLKLDGNNIVFPPKEVLQVQAGSPPNDGFLKERDIAHVVITSNIKKFLRQHAQSMNEKGRNAEHGGHEMGESIETPRMPIKRVTSGRFPIRVNGHDVIDVRSPVLRPPPIPSRSHARGLSQQNTATRRPSVAPLTINNPNERVRSNSETVLQPGRSDRPLERNKRMGIMPRKPSGLVTLDEGEANNRLSHYRGLSHGSSMTTTLDSNVSTTGSETPAESILQRPNYVRRLSVLPEQRRESKILDPILECAKGILYAIFQIHPMIQLVTRLTTDGGTAKHSNLEFVFYNTNVHVEELEQEIQKHEIALENGGPALRENENVQRAVVTLINAYIHVCALLVENMDTIIDNGDPRYIRTMMLLLYNSIMELRVSAYEASRGVTGHVPTYTARWQGLDNTIKPHSRETSGAQMVGRPSIGTKRRIGAYIHDPNQFRSAVDTSLPYLHGNNRAAQIMAATPRSGDSFASSGADPRYPTDFPPDERQFEKIFLSLQKSTDLVMRTLPSLNVQFGNGKRNAEVQRSPDNVLHAWKALISKCGIAIRETESLKARLSKIKLKDHEIRTDSHFWRLCKNFIDSWAEFGSKLKQSMDQVNLSVEIKSRLRPIQISIKETSNLILTSPWGNIFRQAEHFSDTASQHSSSHYSSGSTSTQMQLPMTPQSAALGPAVQATVPSTPISGSFANIFSGNVFERADALISMGGLNLSRSNTMNSTSTISLNSISSITSAGDERQGASMFSPNGTSGVAIQRVNGVNKPAF
ncbi:RAM signaling pathway protein [Xylaria sp. CBS 124048]|nr:RAM signaling pathway protein [Xylaria sp. CBS 124048]